MSYLTNDGNDGVGQHISHRTGLPFAQHSVRRQVAHLHATTHHKTDSRGSRFCRCLGCIVTPPVGLALLNVFIHLHQKAMHQLERRMQRYAQPLAQHVCAQLRVRRDIAGGLRVVRGSEGQGRGNRGEGSRGEGKGGTKLVQAYVRMHGECAQHVKYMRERRQRKGQSVYVKNKYTSTHVTSVQRTINIVLKFFVTRTPDMTEPASGACTSTKEQT